MDEYDRSRAPFRILTQARRRWMAVASSPHVLTAVRLTLVRTDRTERRNRRVSLALLVLYMRTSWIGLRICCCKLAMLCPRASHRVRHRLRSTPRAGILHNNTVKQITDMKTVNVRDQNCSTSVVSIPSHSTLARLHCSTKNTQLTFVKTNILRAVPAE